MTHIMLDLETWGKRPGCDIRSIGAVVFDPVASGGWSVNDHTLMNGETFYVATDNPCTGDEQRYVDQRLVPPRKYPLHRDPETVKWWDDQSDEAQAAFENPVDLRTALAKFSIWIDQITPIPSHANINLKLWANDPHFDVSILEAVYHAVGLPVPWHYRAPRSMKTATDLAGLPRDEYVTATVPHHALHDAIAQAQTVCKCYERLGLAG